MPGVHTVPYSSGGARVAITADGQCGWWGRRTLGEIAFVNEIVLRQLRLECG